MCGSIVSPLWCFSSEWALAQHQPGDSVIILTLIQVKCLFWKTGVNKRNELRVLFKYGVFLCKICVCWVCVCVCVCVSERSCTAGSQPPVRLVQTGCESWVVLRYLSLHHFWCVGGILLGKNAAQVRNKIWNANRNSKLCNEILICSHVRLWISAGLSGRARDGRLLEGGGEYHSLGRRSGPGRRWRRRGSARGGAAENSWG